MLRILFVWLLLNVLVFTTCIQHKADLIVLHVLLLPCRFSYFFLATFAFFIKWPPMRSCISLFLLSVIVGLSTNTLQNSAMPCRTCQFQLTTSDMFGSVLLYVNASGMFFLLLLFSLFCKSSFRSIKSTFSICLFKLSSLYFLSKILFHNYAVPLVLILCRTYSF